jgi:hypothetical protein
MANTSKPSGSVRENVQDVGTTASRYASEMTQKAQDAASSAAETAQNVGRKAGDVDSNLGHKAEDAMSNVGSQMQSLASTIRGKAPHEGMAGSAASYLAGGLESSGRYLQQHDLGDIAQDVSHLIRRYPIQALLVGIGVGFLFARAIRR